MRIDKFLSQLKYCTRSEAKDFLHTHHVIYQNQRILLTKHDVNPEKYDINIDGENVFYKKDIHLMMYKPKGYLSANHDALHPCATDLIKPPYDRFDFSIAGRLDLDAEGLLILTTSGTLVHDITSPKKHLPKVYFVTLDKPFTHGEQLLQGVTILDGKDEPYTATALHLETHQEEVFITIDEGKFHQIKRMFQAVGYNVLVLKRIQMGELSLGKLQPGDYIEFQPEDLYDRNHHASL